MNLLKFMMFMSVWAGLDSATRTDVFIKLNTPDRIYPRVRSVSFDGAVSPAHTYNAVYAHGGVLENPWMGFRVYFDNRQSVDLYAKQRPGLELDSTNFYSGRDDIGAGFGRDVLWAGESVAAGSFRGWQGRPVTIDTVELRRQTVLSPSVLEVEDRGWLFNGHRIDMTQTYAVSADSPDLVVEIRLDGYHPADMFCTGVQKLACDAGGRVGADGRAESFGSNVPDAAMPDLAARVAFSLAVDPANVVSVSEDSLNYLVVVRPDSEGKIRYRLKASSPGFSPEMP